MRSQKINFHPTRFNPLYFELKEALANPSLRFIKIYGGSSAAKTYTISQALIIECISGKNTIVFRKTGSDIQDTVYSDFKDILEKWGYIEKGFFTCYKNIVKCNLNGSYIRFRGLDEDSKIKGLSKFTYVYMNEFDQFEITDFKQARKRLRGRPGQKIIADWNPIDEDHWIKTQTLDTELWLDQEKITTTVSGHEVKLHYSSEKQVNEKGNILLIKTTYLDNYWVIGSPDNSYGYKDQHTLDDFERDKREDTNYYNIYALGNWGKVSIGGEFYKAFDQIAQTKNYNYNPALPLHISFDENVNPYLTLLIWQAEGKNIRCINEICLKHPNNTLNHTLTEFTRQYPENKAGLYVYGDRTSLKADTKLEKGQNFFTLIIDRLKEYNPIQRLPSANPPVKMRGNFINDIFRKRVPEIEIYFHEDCKETIRDFKYVKEASDGTKLKEKKKHPITKVPYEMYTHCSDASDYFVCEYFKREFTDYQRGAPVKDGFSTAPAKKRKF